MNKKNKLIALSVLSAMSLTSVSPLAINSFSNVSSYELQQRDLEELQAIASKLEKKFSYLNQQSRSNKSTVSDLEASKWTGRKPQNMSTYDYDRMQRDDDGR